MENIKSTGGKIIVITGATSGIGKAIALKMAKLGHKIIIVARNPEKIKKILHEISHTTGNTNLRYYIADLSNLKQTTDIGRQIASENPIIDILINNAGMFTANRELTSEGFEKTFATNYLSPFIFTHTLISSLCNSPESQILNVSSSAHFMGKIHWNDFSIKKKWFGFKAYGQSKLLLNLFTFELADKMKDTNIRVNAIHPGIVKTNLGGNKPIKKSKTLENFMSRAVTMLANFPERSAQAIVNVLMKEKYKSASGKYFSLDKIRRSSFRSQNKKNQQKLWDKTYQIFDQTLTFNSIFKVIQVCH